LPPSRVVEDRLRALGDALREEEQAQREQARARREGKTQKQLEAAGVLLRKAKLGDEVATLFGRSRVSILEDPSRRGHVDRFDVREGGFVRLLVKDDADKVIDGPVGVVARKRMGRLDVVFDEPLEDVDPFAVDLVVASDEVTIRRLHDALSRAARAEGRQARLVEALLGGEPPRATRHGQSTTLDDALHEDQRIAASHGLFAEDVALIHGPPGTGKTRVLVEVVRQCAARGERVLCLAASNAAVDHLALSLLDADPSLPLARTGHPARVSAALEAHTLVALTEAHEHRRIARGLVEEALKLIGQTRRRSDRGGRDAYARKKELRAEANKLFADARRLERQAADDVLDRARIVCGTLTGFATELKNDAVYDVCVVDEASQATTPAVLNGALRAGRLVLAGDHKQLPPTVIGRARALSTTVFEELREQDEAGAYSRMLTVQHRMHAALMAFPSTRFYGGALVAHPSVAARTLPPSDDPIAQPARVLDVVDTAGAGLDERAPDAEASASKENPGEADVVVRVVRALLAAGSAPADVGVISPYSGQVALLRAALADVVDAGLEVDTVDGFQGREKDVIVFSAVRSNADAEVGFLADARRLNVAITRAKRKLVVVGDAATLAADETWAALYDHAAATDAHRSVFEFPQE
jgi:ATP-dependent RNA/DNA helicase IGHMBP2